MFYKIADPLPWYRWWSYDLNGCSVLVLDAKSRNESCMSRRILLLKQWRTSISPTPGPRWPEGQLQYSTPVSRFVVFIRF